MEASSLSTLFGAGVWGSSITAIVGLVWRFEERYVSKLEEAITRQEEMITRQATSIDKLQREIDTIRTHNARMTFALLSNGIDIPHET